jgi:hypothetical protein
LRVRAALTGTELRIALAKMASNRRCLVGASGRNEEGVARLTRRIGSAFVAAAVALATAPLVAAGDGKQQIRFNPADQAAARAVVMRRTDLGSSGWQGGRVKPDLSSGPTCPNFHPKVSDLVVTGAAETVFHRSALEFGNVVEILQTRRMVRLDWQRSVLAPGAIPCLRRTIGKGLGPNARLISFAKVPFPHVSAYSGRFRAVISVEAFGREARLVTDIVFVLRGRTEITLNVAGPASAKRPLSAAEARLARLLASRARK